MDQEIKREARKQYFKYFRVWFILLGILLVIAAAVLIVKVVKPDLGRTNGSAPAERVYDYADVLTDQEEDALRDYIARCEAQAKIDIVLVTISEDMEGNGYSWNTSMMNYADDFYDYNDYGYNKPRGDGVLLLDNWYEGQAGSWLSTCGSVYERFGNSEIDRVLDAVYYEVEDDPYEAYRAYVTKVTNYMSRSSFTLIPWMFVIIGPVIVALIFAATHLAQKPAKDTTTASTYVAGGRPEIKDKRDEFIRKNVVSRRIESNGGGGGGHSSGRGGSHRSSSGTHHGGGGRRR